MKFWGNLAKLSIFIFMLLICPINKANAFDSIMEFESRSDTGSMFDYIGNLSFCFEDGYVMGPGDVADFSNTYIPPVLGKDSRPNTQTDSGVSMVSSALSSIGRSMVYFMMMYYGGFAGGLAILAIGTELMIMLEVCTNSYIVQPWEFINREKGGDYWKCQKGNNGKYYNAGSKALTATDVPFYYSCDPKYDPTTGKQIEEGSADAAYIGRVWGYMGAASPYCVGEAKNYEKKERVGQVLVEVTRGWVGRFWSGYDRCVTSGRAQIWLKAGELDLDEGSVQYYGYYHYDSSNAKIKICAATPYTLLPLEVGCSQVAPPAEQSGLDPFLELYTKGTRCYYLLTGRTDLYGLGKALKQTDEKGHDATAMKGFLQSDFHITSTVVGCVKDLIIKVFLSPDNNPGYVNTGFFIVIQDRLRGIVYAALVLYVALLGIKIISSPQVPSQGEFLMFIIKFGLVVYFTTPSAWYYVVNGEAQGLFPTLVWASDEIGAFFMNAENANDPVGMCRYILGGQELLAQRDIPPSSIGSGVQPTIGFNNLKMTMWDLVDCKLINYMNLGSCSYSLGGIIGMWMVSAAFLVGAVGFLLAIVSFIYVLILLLVVFKFAHMFILAVFIIAILVLLSPIFLCFSLFQATKSIFDNWIKMILGYILYPALLFAFVALMLVTFDSIYYGDLVLAGGKKISGGNLDNVLAECQGIDSLYCNTVKHLQADPCLVSVGKMSDLLTEKFDLGPLGSFTRLKSGAASDYLDVVVKMMLFAVIYYFFLGSVTSFLAVLTGVQDLGGMAKGSIDLFAMTQKMGGKAMGGITSKLGGMTGSLTGGGGGGGGGMMGGMGGMMGGGSGGGGGGGGMPGMGG